MSALAESASAFVDIAHRVVWASVSTVDPDGRPRSRVLHPIWEWDGESLVGWIGTGQTPVKTAALAGTPFVSVNYWDSAQDVATAECSATWCTDIETCQKVWDMYVNAAPPLGYDPSVIPVWESAESEAFSVLRLDPYRLRAFPGTMLLEGVGVVHNWRSAERCFSAEQIVASLEADRRN